MLTTDIFPVITYKSASAGEGESMSLQSAKANASLAREEKDIAKKIDYLACAIEEIADGILRSSQHPVPAPIKTKLGQVFRQGITT
jgi:hypothetical protein